MSAGSPAERARLHLPSCGHLLPPAPAHAPTRTQASCLPRGHRSPHHLRLPSSVHHRGLCPNRSRTPDRALLSAAPSLSIPRNGLPGLHPRSPVPPPPSLSDLELDPQVPLEASYPLDASYAATSVTALRLYPGPACNRDPLGPLSGGPSSVPTSTHLPCPHCPHPGPGTVISSQRCPSFSRPPEPIPDCPFSPQQPRWL